MEDLSPQPLYSNIANMQPIIDIKAIKGGGRPTRLLVAGLALCLVAFTRATLVVLCCGENGTAVLSIEL